MKNSIYFSAVLGLTFLVLRFIGLFIDMSNKELFLWIGTGILLLVTLPLYLTDRIRYKKKKQTILKSFEKDNRKARPRAKSTKTGAEYPSFRKQKSGLTWGGGNIHGSSAKRGSKRGFLQR